MICCQYQYLDCDRRICVKIPKTPVAILSKQQATELKDLDKKVVKIGQIKMSLNQSINKFGAEAKEAAALEILQIIKKGMFEYAQKIN